jgi:hypothetical protein
MKDNEDISARKLIDRLVPAARFPGDGLSTLRLRIGGVG